MAKYRIYLDEIASGTVIVDAANKEEAEDLGLDSTAIDWCHETERHVCRIVELDEDGEELS